jgi:hypothetical protein
MVCNTDTKANFLLCYKDVFGFTAVVAAALYEEQLLQDKKTLAKINDSKINSICCTIRRTTAIAKISVARLKLMIFWIKHQDPTLHKIDIPGKPLVKVTLDMTLTLMTQRYGAHMGGEKNINCYILRVFTRGWGKNS